MVTRVAQSMSKTGLYKTVGKAPSSPDSTLRTRLVGMKEALLQLRANIQEMRGVVKDYKEKLKEWKKTETNISSKERNEQQLKAAR